MRQSLYLFVRLGYISILNLRYAVLGSISDTADILQKVNDFFQETEREPPFDVQLVGFSSEVKLHSGKFIIQPDFCFDDLKKTDLIVIPSFPDIHPVLPMEIGRKTINEIMDEVGYSDIRVFRELFKRITGLMPNDCRNKYNKANTR